MSPLVRAWLAERLPDWADHAYACWRALTHRLTCRPCRAGHFALCEREWDPCESARVRCEICDKDNKLPAPVNADTVAAGQPGTGASQFTPSPASNPHWRPWRRQYMLRVCRTDLGGCGSHIGAPCVTADGKVTGPHRARRLP